MSDRSGSGFKITVTPLLRVRNAVSAIEYYQRGLGAVELDRHTAPDGTVVYAELKIGDARFSLAEESPGSPSPQTLGGSPVSFDLIVPNVDALANKAVAAGATVLYPVEDQTYGLRQGRLIDPFGHHWSIGSPI